MLKGLMTSCLAIAVLSMGAQMASAQHGGQGCRISNAFNGIVGNAYGGANCGREISNYEAAALWSDYCYDNCTINQGCGGGCGSSCGLGFGKLFARGCGTSACEQPANDCGCGCGGRAGHCLGGKLRGMFSGIRGGGDCGCGDCFGYPAGCASDCGGCNTGCDQGCDSGCNAGCGGRLRGKLAGMFSHRGCGCRLFSCGNWHDRMFSGFYARHGARGNYFNAHACGCCQDFTSAVNGQITGACGCGGGAVQAPMTTTPMTPVDSGSMQQNGADEVSPVVPAEVAPNDDGASYYQSSSNRVAESVLLNRRGF